MNIASRSTTPIVRARAYINKNRVAGYQEEDDIEISALLDTNGDGSVSVGDEVRFGQYPLSFDPCPDPNGLCTEIRNYLPRPDPVIVAILDATPTPGEIEVNTQDLPERFRWRRVSDQEQFTYSNGPTHGGFMSDRFVNEFFDRDRLLIFGEGSAVGHSALVEPEIRKSGGTDEYWLNIEFPDTP